MKYNILLVKFILDTEGNCVEALEKKLNLSFVPYPGMILFVNGRYESVEVVTYRDYDDTIECCTEVHELEENEDVNLLSSSLFENGWYHSEEIMTSAEERLSIYSESLWDGESEESAQPEGSVAFQPPEAQPSFDPESYDVDEIDLDDGDLTF